MVYAKQQTERNLRLNIDFNARVRNGLEMTVK